MFPTLRTCFTLEVNTRLVASQTGFPVRFPLVSVLCLNAWNSICQVYPLFVAIGPVMLAVSCAGNPRGTSERAVVDTSGGVTAVLSPAAPQVPFVARYRVPSGAITHRVAIQKYVPGAVNTMGSECTSPVPVTDFIPEVNTRLLASQTGFPVRVPLVSVLCLNAWNSTCQLRPVSVATGPVTCAVSRACCPSVTEDVAVVVIPGGVTVVVSPAAPHTPWVMVFPSMSVRVSIQ